MKSLGETLKELHTGNGVQMEIAALRETKHVAGDVKSHGSGKPK